VILLFRLDQSFFQDIMPTFRAFRGLFENVIGHARISAGYPIEKIVYCRTLDKYHNLFLGRWIKKVAHRAGSLAPGHDAGTRIHFNGIQPKWTFCPFCATMAPVFQFHDQNTTASVELQRHPLLGYLTQGKTTISRAITRSNLQITGVMS